MWPWLSTALGPAASSAVRVAFAGGLAASVLILRRPRAFPRDGVWQWMRSLSFSPTPARGREPGFSYSSSSWAPSPRSWPTAGVAVAALRDRAPPRWLGWSSVVTAGLHPLAIGFVGFLVFFLSLHLVSGVLAFRSATARRPHWRALGDRGGPRAAGPADRRSRVEADLVAKAGRMDPKQLHAAGRRALEIIEPGSVQGRRRRGRPAAR